MCVFVRLCVCARTALTIPKMNSDGQRVSVTNSQISENINNDMDVNLFGVESIQTPLVRVYLMKI